MTTTYFPVTTSLAIKENVATVAAAGSKTNLTSTQEWVGDFIEVTNQTAIQLISLFNRDVQIYIDQSLNGTDVVITDDWITLANVGFSTSVTSVAPYYRVRLTNLYAGAATGSMVSASTAVFNILPRKLNHNGNFQIGMPIDHLGVASKNTAQGDQRSVTPFRLVGAQMDFNGHAGAVDPSYWSTIVSGGSVTVSNSLCSINSSTGAAAYAKLASIRRARYVTGYENRFRANMRISTNQADNTKRFGIGVHSNYTFTVDSATAAVGDVYSNNSQLFTVVQPLAAGTTLYCRGTGAPTTGNLVRVDGAGTDPIVQPGAAGVASWVISDGAFFQMAASTFTCVIYKNGSPTNITAFNGHLGTSYTPSTDIHTYEIFYTNVKVYFVIDGELLHTYSATTSSWAATMDFYIYCENINSGNTTNTVLGLRNAAIHRLGPESTQVLNYRLASSKAVAVLKYSAGNVRGITINTATDGAVITLYDGRSILGKVIDSWTTSNASALPATYPLYNLPFSDGLTLETKTQNASVTVFYE